MNSQLDQPTTAPATGAEEAGGPRVLVGIDGSPGARAALVQAWLAASEDAELLVVASRGHGALRGLLLGSVALRCVVHGRCPVPVVRTSRHTASEPAGESHPAAVYI